MIKIPGRFDTHIIEGGFSRNDRIPHKPNARIVLQNKQSIMREDFFTKFNVPSFHLNYEEIALVPKRTTSCPVHEFRKEIEERSMLVG